jgi:hypothetical protein
MRAPVEPPVGSGVGLGFGCGIVGFGVIPAKFQFRPGLIGPELSVVATLWLSVFGSVERAPAEDRAAARTSHHEDRCGRPVC